MVPDHIDDLPRRDDDNRADAGPHRRFALGTQRHPPDVGVGPRSRSHIGQAAGAVMRALMDGPQYPFLSSY